MYDSVNFLCVSLSSLSWSGKEPARKNIPCWSQYSHWLISPLLIGDARTFNQKWQEKTRPINRAFYGRPRHHPIEHRIHHADTKGLPVPSSGETHPELLGNRQSHGKRRQRPPSLSEFGDGNCLDSDTCHRIKHAKAHCPQRDNHDHHHCSSSATARSYHPSFHSTGATEEVHRHTKARTGHSKTAVKFDTTGSGPTEKMAPNKSKGTHIWISPASAANIASRWIVALHIAPHHLLCNTQVHYIMKMCISHLYCFAWCPSIMLSRKNIQKQVGYEA